MASCDDDTRCKRSTFLRLQPWRAQSPCAFHNQRPLRQRYLAAAIFEWQSCRALAGPASWVVDATMESLRIPHNDSDEASLCSELALDTPTGVDEEPIDCHRAAYRGGGRAAGEADSKEVAAPPGLPPHRRARHASAALVRHTRQRQATGRRGTMMHAKKSPMRSSQLGSMRLGNVNPMYGASALPHSASFLSPPRPLGSVSPAHSPSLVASGRESPTHGAGRFSLAALEAMRGDSPPIMARASLAARADHVAASQPPVPEYEDGSCRMCRRPDPQQRTDRCQLWCCSCCDRGTAWLACYGLAFASLITLHGCGALIADSLRQEAAPCSDRLANWMLTVSALGAVAFATAAWAAGCWAHGKGTGVLIAGLLSVVYSVWGWYGVGIGAALAEKSQAGFCPPESWGTVLGIGVFSGVTGAGASMVAVVWHLLTRRQDMTDRCRGCCNLGTCICPGRYVEATREVNCCLCCRCQVESKLPPPPPADLVGDLSRKQFSHAEACMQCAVQVGSADHISLRTFGGACGDRALHLLRQKEQERLGDARRKAAGIGAGSRLGANPLQDVVPRSSRPGRFHPARAMQLASQQSSDGAQSAVTVEGDAASLDLPPQPSDSPLSAAHSDGGAPAAGSAKRSPTGPSPRLPAQ